MEKPEARAISTSASWNLDFWGRFRRATEAARANMLASEWAQKAVISSLVSNVAGSCFTLRQLDMQLEISRRTLVLRQDSLQLTQSLEGHGFNTMLDVRQAQQLVYTGGGNDSGSSCQEFQPGLASMGERRSAAGQGNSLHCLRG